MSSSIDEQFVEFVVKSLVNKPDAVKVERRIDEKGVLLELTVDPEDLGRVIGKRGATAQSIRTLLRALGTKNDARYNLKIVDNGPNDRPPRQPSQQDDSYASSSDASSVSTDNDSTAPVTDDSQPAVDEDEQDEQIETPESATEEEPQEETSDRLSKARKELEDLDDLDI
jgi:uncharacterized protein